MAKQLQRIRWTGDTYQFENEDGEVVRRFGNPQSAAEHHYRMWSENETYKTQSKPDDMPISVGGLAMDIKAVREQEDE